KQLIFFSFFLVLSPAIVYCNDSVDQKKRYLQLGNKYFQQKNLDKLKKVRLSSKGQHINHWIDYWTLKLKIERNPFDKSIKEELRIFSKEHSKKYLVVKVYRFWAHEVIKKRQWSRTSQIIDYIRNVSPQTSSQSINCVKNLSRKTSSLESVKELTSGEEFRIGCLQLILMSIKNGIADKNFIINSSRSASISGNINHATQILNLAKKSNFVISPSEYKLTKVLSVSQRNSLRALRRFKSIKRILTKEQESFVSMVVGSSLLGITHSSTLNLVKVGISSVNNQPVNVLESTARVALRYGDWGLLEIVIQAMPVYLQKTPKWKYWKAQLLLKEGEKVKSAKLLDSIKPPWSFYGMLSGEELARIYNPKKHISYRIPTIDQDFKEILNSNSFKTALLLYEVGLYREGRMEWENVLRKKTDKSLINIAKYLSSQGIFDRSISAALKTKNEHNFYLRFPIPYKKIVKEEARSHKISPSLIMSLMRQESRFKEKIVSPAGAIGLMQLMPSTARSVARKIKLKSVGKKSLSNPIINVKLGSSYLENLFSKFKGSALLSVAAYNAGPSRSRKWKRSLRMEISGAAFTESIPFDETRDYVKFVLSGAVMYSRLYDQKSTWNSEIQKKSFLTLQSLLTKIQP
ncbi:MAG: hypothetical protein CBD16_08600, partial [Betaproteobacteria bacterium TMED156]